MRGFKITDFGIITVSVDVTFSNVSVFSLNFSAFMSQFQRLRIRAFCDFLGNKIAAPISPNVPVRLCV